MIEGFFMWYGELDFLFETYKMIIMLFKLLP
jgi:hypothetical protein